jgi:hypothetical protein
VTVRFRVDEKGRPERFSFEPERLPASARLGIIEAAASCLWLPATDREGRPVAGWVVRTYRLR